MAFAQRPKMVPMQMSFELTFVAVRTVNSVKINVILSDFINSNIPTTTTSVTIFKFPVLPLIMTERRLHLLHLIF